MFPKNDSNDLYPLMKEYNAQRVREAESHRLIQHVHKGDVYG